MGKKHSQETRPQKKKVIKRCRTCFYFSDPSCNYMNEWVNKDYCCNRWEEKKETVIKYPTKEDVFNDIMFRTMRRIKSV